MTTLPPESNEGQGTNDAQGAEQAAQAPTPPPAAPQYEAPPAGQQAPQPQAAPQAADPVGNIQLNYWLSVFFTWIPALIFWIIEKDKGNQRATEFHRSNLNFSLLRTGVAVGIWIIGLIPYIGWLIAILLWLGSIVLFVFHIMGAAKAAENYRNNGKTDPFIFNIPLIK